MIVTISLRSWRRHWRLAAAAAILAVALPAWWRDVHAGSRGGSNPHLVWYVKTKQKVAALTFDDGPSPTATPKILNILAAHHARATFFVLGQAARQYPEIVRQEARAGMEIGNHTYAHINLKLHSKEQDAEDLKHTQKLVGKIIGRAPDLMRPPYGAYDASVITVAHQLKLKVVLWSWTEDSKDWTNPGVSSIVSRVVNHIQPGDIVLFHDGGGNRDQTVAALPLILNDLTAMGYRLVTVSQLLTYSAPQPVVRRRQGELVPTERVAATKTIIGCRGHCR